VATGRDCVHGLARHCKLGDAGWLTLIVAVAVMVVATVALTRGEAAGATRQPG
jgi:hypothetical protein